MNMFLGVGGRKRKTPAEMAAEAAKAEEDDSLINSVNLALRVYKITYL